MTESKCTGVGMAPRRLCIGVLTGISGKERTEAGAVAIYDDVAALRAGLAASPVGALLAVSGHSGGRGQL